MGNRPLLNESLSADTFRDFYWLKSELLVFCRKHGLGTVGTKAELAERIDIYLRTGQHHVVFKSRKQSAQMPDRFSLDSVIGEGWRCTRELRAFFVEYLGPGFRFNAVMRRFIHERPGHTLAEAIAAYQQDKVNPRHKEIGKQFEYNRFTREFWLKHPDATRADLTAAWYKFRNTARSER